MDTNTKNYTCIKFSCVFLNVDEPDHCIAVNGPCVKEQCDCYTNCDNCVYGNDVKSDVDNKPKEC